MKDEEQELSSRSIAAVSHLVEYSEFARLTVFERYCRYYSRVGVQL